MTQHEHIIATARGYIGTRFLHQGRLKKTAKHKGGVDCLGLLVGVARECNLRSKTGELLADVDEFNYPHYPDAARLCEMLTMHLHEVQGGRCQAADIALFEIDGRAQHMGILASPPTTLIHAYAPARCVVEHALDNYWRQKIAGIFRISPTNH